MSYEELIDQKTVRKIGFGCGRLVGGSSFKHSAKLVEAALKLGIRHFDVAPSYGLGTAEDVLGVVLDGEKEVKIATKVGIARPSGGAQLSVLRKYIAPVLKSSKILESIAVKVLAKRSARGVFDVDSIALSIDDSLQRLRRTKVDFLLLHEPRVSDVNDELITYCDNLIVSGIAGSLGLGFNHADIDNDFLFGTVMQRNIGALLDTTKSDNRYHIVHGTMRSSCEQITNLIKKNNPMVINSYKKLGWDINNKDVYGATALGLAIANGSIDIALVSFSDVRRMIQTIEMADSFVSIINDHL